jgi:hypothetical protein
MPEWNKMHHDFHLPSLYYSIINLFEDDAEDPWAIDTLKYWNE